MPGMDGLSFVRKLRDEKRGGGMKIVALSAYPPTAESQPLFDGYLTKPIDPFHLATSIEKMIDD